MEKHLLLEKITWAHRERRHWTVVQYLRVLKMLWGCWNYSQALDEMLPKSAELISHVRLAKSHREIVKVREVTGQFSLSHVLSWLITFFLPFEPVGNSFRLSIGARCNTRCTSLFLPKKTVSAVLCSSWDRVCIYKTAHKWSWMFTQIQVTVEPLSLSTSYLVLVSLSSLLYQSSVLLTQAISCWKGRVRKTICCWVIPLVPSYSCTANILQEIYTGMTAEQNNSIWGGIIFGL